MNQVSQFGPYKLLQRISVGGMAEVYKAIEHGVEGFERTVAVKRILPHIAEDDEFITMFKDEAKIAGQLTHGNIAQIYNLGQQDDSFYIAMEYVAGKDVRSIFTRCAQSKKPMPVAQGCFIVMKVCEGLDYAHNKKDKHGRHLNIIHRDVSPPNILVSYEGEVKLIDFGVAKAAGRVSKTQAGILKGKFGYMSPEQVRGMQLDRRSDVFSLGVVLYEVLTGTRLFQGDTDFATLEKVRSVDVPPPSGRNPEIPPALEEVVMKALSGEPETRYQSAMELHDGLQAFLFKSGMHYSRNDLAAWMRKNYAREIELDKQTNSTKGKKPRPPIPGRRPPSGKAPPPPVPGRGRPASGPRAGRAKDSLKPSPEQLAAMRKRSKTMLMSGSRPSILKPEKRGGPPLPTGAPPRAGNRPTPVKRPSPARPTAKASAASDFDWDDDELETKLFDEGVKTTPVEAKPPEQVVVAPVAHSGPRPAAAPVGAAAPAAKTPAQPIAQVRTPAAATPAVAPTAAPVAAPMPTAVDLDDDDEDLRPGMVNIPGLGRKPIALVAGIGGGAVLLLIVLIMIFSGGDDETEADTSAATETVDKPVAAAPGTLTVDVTPPDAKVEVDGKEHAGASPRVVPNLEGDKKHKLVVSKGDDYLPYEQEVTVPAGNSLNIPVKLDLKEVTLTVETEPKNAKIALVSGETVEPKGKGGESFKLVREAGVEYQLEGSLKGYKTDRVPITFDGTAAQTVKLALVRDGEAKPEEKPPEVKKVKKPSTPAKPKTATLRIAGAAGFPPATVWVDGRKQSKKTPVQVKVSAGSHNVKWKWPNGKTARKSVSVKDKQAVVVKP